MKVIVDNERKTDINMNSHKNSHKYLLNYIIGFDG